MSLVRNAIQHLHQNGFSETLAYGQHWVSEKLGEQRLGISTQQSIWLRDFGYDTQYLEHEPAPYRALATVMKRLPMPLDRPDILVEYGSGAGRSALVAAMTGRFPRIIGVEILPQLIEIAEANRRAVDGRLTCRVSASSRPTP